MRDTLTKLPNWINPSGTRVTPPRDSPLVLETASTGPGAEPSFRFIFRVVSAMYICLCLCVYVSCLCVMFSIFREHINICYHVSLHFSMDKRDGSCMFHVYVYVYVSCLCVSYLMLLFMLWLCLWWCLCIKCDRVLYRIVVYTAVYIVLCIIVYIVVYIIVSSILYYSVHRNAYCIV